MIKDKFIFDNDTMEKICNLKIDYNTDCVYFRFRGIGFSEHGIESLKACVNKDGISLFDSIAGYYTQCHSLSKNATNRIRKAERIARKNELNLAFNHECHLSVDYVIDGWR